MLRYKIYVYCLLWLYETFVNINVLQFRKETIH